MVPMRRSVPVRPASRAAVSVSWSRVGRNCSTSLLSWVARAVRMNWSSLMVVWQL
jgi:hypothetical protein